MSACGLDECREYGGCLFDCQYSRKANGNPTAMDLALIEDAEKLSQLKNNINQERVHSPLGEKQ